MRAFMAATTMLIVLGVAPAAGAAGAAGSNGVQRGAPVIVRMNPDNEVANAVNQAVASAGLGTVTFDGFHPDCSAVAGQVVICRDPSLQKTKHPRASRTGPNFCVVRLDPKIGGAPHGITVLSKALKKCVR